MLNYFDQQKSQNQDHMVIYQAEFILTFWSSLFQCMNYTFLRFENASTGLAKDIT